MHLLLSQPATREVSDLTFKLLPIQFMFGCAEESEVHDVQAEDEDEWTTSDEAEDEEEWDGQMRQLQLWAWTSLRLRKARERGQRRGALVEDESGSDDSELYSEQVDQRVAVGPQTVGPHVEEVLIDCASSESDSEESSSEEDEGRGDEGVAPPEISVSHRATLDRIRGLLETQAPPWASLQQRGKETYYQERYDEAISYFTLAIRAYPKGAPEQHFSNRSAAFYAKGQYADALADADAAVVQNPQWAMGHSRRANALHALQRLDEAHVAYEKALEVDPQNQLVRDSLENLKQQQQQALQHQEPPGSSSPHSDDGSGSGD